MKKRWLVGAAVIAAASTCLSLASCGNSTSSEDSGSAVNVKFFGWGTTEEQSNFQTMIDKFMELNHDVTVTYEAASSANYMIMLKNKAQNLPDLFYMPDYEFASWADADKLLDLSPYVSADETKDIWPVAIDMYHYDIPTHSLGNGKALYGLPKDLGPYSLVYNKTLMQKIATAKGFQVEYPSATTPMSWSDFVTFLQKYDYTDPSAGKIYGVGYYEPMHAVYSNNADFWSSDIATSKITEANFVQAIQWIADLNLVYQVAPDAKEAKSANGYQRFLNSKCLMTFMGPWDQKAYWTATDFEYDIMPTPVGPATGAKSTSWIGSVALSCRKFKSSETRKQEAAIRLAKFLTLDPITSEMNYQLGQAMPNIMSIAKTKWYTNEGLEGRQKLPESKKVWVDMTAGNDYVRSHNRAKYYLYLNSPYDDLISDIADNVNTGQKKASDFLASYESTFQRGLNDNKAYI